MLTIRLIAMLLLIGILPVPAAEDPTVEEAAAFMEEAEKLLMKHWIRNERADWVQQNFITEDTEIMAAEAYGDLMAVTARLAKEAVRFDSLELPYDLARKIMLIKTSQSLAAPEKQEEQAELARLTTALSGMYGRGKYCPAGGECLDLGQISRIFSTSRDHEQLLDLWQGWRTVSPPMRDLYSRFVDLGNKGSRELGFDDVGSMWRSGYDMPPDSFAAEVERLWEQVEPLYKALHCHVRASLSEFYGPEVVPETGPIPAHLLGNMWAQSWGYIYDLVAPEGQPGAGFDLTTILRDRGVDELEMVRYGERFFQSLGFDPLPPGFWEKSLFVKPADREVICHASAWNIDWQDDLRLKMCIEINAEDFATVHHELGHNYYQWAYNNLPTLYQNGANDGFHEGIGDTLALSITPEYLVRTGLLDRVPENDNDLEILMRMALDKVAFLPFGLLVDQWRWKVFSGEIAPEQYNAAWWELRQKYQGVMPPVPRSEADFDPGAKYHIPANTPYTRYFLADVLQFQFHKALCRAAGHEGPLHRCSIYNNKQAGEKLINMMKLGMSRPWSEALRAISGQSEMDAGALYDYFEPLKQWLDQQNEGRTCGW